MMLKHQLFPVASEDKIFYSRVCSITAQLYDFFARNSVAFFDLFSRSIQLVHVRCVRLQQLGDDPTIISFKPGSRVFQMHI